MLPSVRVVVLALCSTAAAACGFDSNGLATGSNSAGTLESTGGGDSSEGDDNPGTTAMPTTSATGSSTQGNTSDEGSSTMLPSTTQEPTESSGTATGSTGTDGSEVSSSDASMGSSSEGAGTSSESGPPAADPYGMCDGDEDCGTGVCVTLLLAFEERNVCYPPCSATPECPAPATGEAETMCTFSGCALDCSDGGGGTVDCPDGMACGDNGDGGRRCLWP